MRTIISIIVVALIPTVLYAWPWSTDMMNQPSVKPQEGVMPPFPARSVPASGYPTKVKNREEAKPLTNPVAASEESLHKGKQLFLVYCAACHGLTGKADSPVSNKIGAISLVDDYVQTQLTEGWVWGTITFGSAIMPAYGNPQARADKRGSNDLSPTERWHVVNYVKHGLAKDAAATQQAAKSGGEQH